MRAPAKNDKRICYDFEYFHDGKLGVCPTCERRIMLPCIACRAEAERRKNSADRPIRHESGLSDLRINLRSEEERSRYEQVRLYRDKYERPMMGEIVEQ